VGSVKPWVHDVELRTGSCNLTPDPGLSGIAWLDTFWQPNMSTVGQTVSGRQSRSEQEGLDVTWSGV